MHLLLHRINTYNDQRFTQYGTITIPCKYLNGTWKMITFYVADTPGPVIYGLSMSKKLGMVTINCDVSVGAVYETKEGIKINTLKELMKHYPDRFTGRGKFPRRYKLTLKEDAVPVIHPPRRAPIQLRDKIKAELDRMEKLGVIRKISEPCEWVSSSTYPLKLDNTLRLCLDPRNLNGALSTPYINTRRANTQICWIASFQQIGRQTRLLVNTATS